MITRLASGASAFVRRVFPERQIYHRAEGQVHYISLSTRAQLLAATASAVVMGWTAYATASVFLRGHLLSAQSHEAARIKARYEHWLAEARAREASALALLQSRTTDFEESAREFERRHQTLVDLLEHATGGDAPGRGMRVARTDIDDAVLMTAAVENPSPRQSRLAIEMAARDSEVDPGDRFAALASDQERQLALAEEASQDRVENLRAVLRMTNLSVQQVLEAGATGAGGPFVGVSEEEEEFAAALDLEDEFSRRVARVAARVAEAERLERAIESAPLGRPLADEFRITSEFGRRIDPVTGRPAVHHGLDFGAYHLAPIMAAAPGQVSFVGWRGGYGRVVEIDHGHGFKTRYAHLQRATVQRGDTVAFGERVGQMGSTGRSTGDHLHYEVWFKGKVYDPTEFLKAGNYVQQG
jgi:murein DD-endopeptidase MepM/ murein hydrolase activator NlpD